VSNGTRHGRRALALGVLAVASIAITGCTDAPAPAPTDSASPEYISDYVAPAPMEIAPLRGTAIEPGTATNPSIAAKIDNHVAARPQVGLETTDIVFEELVEGGLTRYVAIWQSNIPKELGPVRSIRPMDPDILSPFKGIVAYSGGQPRFVQLMQSTPVYNAIHGQSDTATTFYRSTKKLAPHNVLVKAREVIADHKNLKAPGQQFGYALDLASSTALKEGKPTSTVSLVFGPPSKPSWKWSETKSAWLRSQNGTKDKDSKGDQLAATNLIVLRVGVNSALGVPKTELVGKGEAWVAAGGSYVHAKWSKSSRTARIKLVDDEGVVIRLAPGNTWIEMVPSTGSVKFSKA
jgi:hypothetical protein